MTFLAPSTTSSLGSPRRQQSPRKPHSELTAPKRLMRKLKSYVTPRKQRRYIEKRLYGDSYDYDSAEDSYGDDEDEDEDDAGFVLVTVPRWQGSGRIRGEKRAGVAAWELDSRSRMV